MTVGTQAAANGAQSGYLAGETGVGGWFATRDHKKIGLMFAGWTSFAFLLGALFGLVPVIMSLGGPGVDSRVVFQTLTYHRLLLVFLFLVPAVPATLGYFLLPLQIGAANMALPNLARGSLRFYVLGLALILVSLMTGPIATGWTLAAPLSLAETGTFGLVATGLFLVALSWFLTGVNFLVTVHHNRTPGMGFFDMPIMAWSMYLTGYMLTAVGVLFAILIAYLAASRFSDSGMFSDDPGLWIRYFWFVMTPAAFFALLPAFGVVLEIVAGISRRVVVGYKMVVGSMIALLGLSFVTWGVYLSGQGQDPVTTLVFSTFSILTAVPVALLAYSLLATLHQGSVAGKGPDTFVVGFLLHGGIACLMGMSLASPALGAYLGTTMFLTTQLDYLIWGGALFALLAGLHFWWPKMIGREYQKDVARIGAGLMIIGLNLALIPRMIMGTRGVAPDMIALMPGPAGLALLSAFGWMLVYSGLLVAIGNLVASIWKGEPTVSNPWGAGTLEWRTDSPPPAGNFEMTPEVEGPYTY